MTAGRVVVIGVGNEFRRDDGAGPAVISSLARLGLPGVELATSDGEPTRLLDLWHGAALAVVIDAVRSDSRATAGTVHRATPDDPIAPAASSTHGLGVPGALRLAQALDRLPASLVIFGIEGSEFGYGNHLSEAVTEAIPDVVSAVIDEIATVVQR